MTLQTSGTISMNEINRELKGYTASGTSISLGFSTPRRMAGTHYIRPYLNVGFLRSQVAYWSSCGKCADTSGYEHSVLAGYIKDYYGSGSHLGSLSSSAGVYIPSSGDTLNQFTEREVLECYTDLL